MYILILTIVFWGDGSQAGSGGASVNTIKTDTLEQCLAVKSVFLNDMKMTTKEITGRTFETAVITRRAKCIKL